MLLPRASIFRLDPTAAQQEVLHQWIGCCRAVYNCALVQRRDHWRAFRSCEGQVISFRTQGRELTALRAAFSWIGACPIQPQQYALKDLDRAFKAFFAGRARHPTPRRKFVNDTIRFPARDCTIERLNRSFARVKLPKIGWIRFRITRSLPTALKSVAIRVVSSGWQVVIAGATMTTPLGLTETVGVDRGVTCSTALSTGETPAFPRAAIRIAEARAKAHQRIASGRARGSKRYAKARRLAARSRAQAARIRRHAQHVETARIAKRFGIVFIEDLRIAAMRRSAKGTIDAPGSRVRQKAGLNRSILETGWGLYETFLAYKLATTGGELRLVDPRNTSRRCHACDHVDAASRQSQALFRCVACGHEAHADVNAARNILRAGTRPSSGASVRRESQRKAA